MKHLALAGIMVLALFSFNSDVQEEGMFPMSHLSKLDLKKAGLEIEVDDIYNEEKPSLVNALVRLGGCTGSFISDKGLIITNHHCVFSSVAAASTPEENHLENGFYASTSEKEIKTTLPCKITLSYDDVSDAVLEGVDALDAIAKQKKIGENIKAIVKAEEEKNKDLTIEVSEMLVGKSYTLFRYKTLNDVRLVYVPPKNIGKFGGETDNWEWPRHNGDFSVVRAYEDGKPYTPEKYLVVNPGGTKEGDFTFILGYPGRTYRNQTAEFLTYQNDYILPLISNWYDYRINTIEEFAGNSVAKQLAYSGKLASLNNVSKNFKGKMQGLQRTDVLAKTKSDQQKLLAFAKTNESFSSYVPLFKKNEELYNRKFELITDLYYLGQFARSGLFATASNIAGFQNVLSGLSKKDQKAYLDSNQKKLDKSFGGFLKAGTDKTMDKKVYSELFYRLSQSKLKEVRALFNTPGVVGKNAIKARALSLYTSSSLLDSTKNNKIYNKQPLKFLANKSDFVQLATVVGPVLASKSKEMGEINAEINAIIPRFNDLEQEVNGGNFVPDANATLRFTYGYVNGYEPEDAVVFSPFTTVEGILEKSVGSDNKDYFLQSEFIEKLREVEPADVLKHPKHNSVVVAFLYNMDTTGGNSGSPIMDSKGRIVGVNFDRAYTATINDYAWNESYSRSIGVDIRYVLYVMKYFGEADEVLEEMGVVL